MRSKALAFLMILASAAAGAADAPAWFEETFDTYTLGPLRKQGGWDGPIDRIAVVSTHSLAGNATFLDADSPMLPILIQAVERHVDVPTSGVHVFSFAVKADTRTPFSDTQATLELRTSATATVTFAIESDRVSIIAQHPLLDIPPSTAEWDLGTSPGGHVDFTTGTYHMIELEMDFGDGNSFITNLLDVRFDGQSQARYFTRMPTVIWWLPPAATVMLVNGATLQPAGAVEDAVFFDSMLGRPASLAVRRWEEY